MTKKKTPKKQIIEAELKIHSDLLSAQSKFMCVEQDGYKAVFHEKEHREMVTYLLAKVEGYSAMIQTLSTAINLIEQRK